MKTLLEMWDELPKVIAGGEDGILHQCCLIKDCGDVGGWRYLVLTKSGKIKRYNYCEPCTEPKKRPATAWELIGMQSRGELDGLICSWGSSNIRSANCTIILEKDSEDQIKFAKFAENPEDLEWFTMMVEDK